MEKKSCALILAGGEGKRMKSNRPKAMSEVLFKPMLRWVLDAVKDAEIDDICIVTGFKHEVIEEYIEALPFKVSSAIQTERLGTGHAVMMAREFLEQHRDGNVLVLNGDAPFIDSETIKNSSMFHKEGCTVISAKVENPFGYGRIIRGEGDSLNAIVEEKEATDEQRKISEVNSGAYWYNTDSLLNALNKIKPSEKTGEYYLTDAAEIIRKSGKAVSAFMAETSDSVLGANDCEQLGMLNEIARKRVLKLHMSNGVNIPCSDGVIIGTDVTIGTGTTILPASIIKGSTKIGEGCVLGPSVLLENCVIDSGKEVALCVKKG